MSERIVRKNPIWFLNETILGQTNFTPRPKKNVLISNINYTQLLIDKVGFYPAYSPNSKENLWREIKSECVVAKQASNSSTWFLKKMCICCKEIALSCRGACHAKDVACCHTWEGKIMFLRYNMSYLYVHKCVWS